MVVVEQIKSQKVRTFLFSFAVVSTKDVFIINFALHSFLKTLVFRFYLFIHSFNNICLGIMLNVRNAKISYDTALEHLLIQKVEVILIDVSQNAAG